MDASLEPLPVEIIDRVNRIMVTGSRSECLEEQKSSSGIKYCP